MNEEAPALTDQQKIDAIWEMLAIVAGKEKKARCAGRSKA